MTYPSSSNYCTFLFYTETFPPLLNDIIAIISYTLATLIVVALVVFVVVKRRKRSFSPRAAANDSEQSAENVGLYESEK